jgi:predicted Rossmann-fold nucleotide-binding protein
VITGAGPGLMRAGHEGAGRENSFGVNIRLPFEQSANDLIAGDAKLVNFKYFFTRKLSFVKESDAIVLYPGGFGTLDEGFESLTLLQTGKCDPLPVICMDLPGGDYWPSFDAYLRDNLLSRGLISNADRNLFRYTTDIDKAVHEIELFYRAYHSLRYVGDYAVLRLKRRPTAQLLAILNERYRDLLASGDFEAVPPHRAERNEPDAIRALPRIGFHFVQRGFGRLRRLIDELNLVLHDEPEALAVEPRPGTAALQMPAPDPRDSGEGVATVRTDEG